MTALFVPLHGFVEVIALTVIINILGFSEVETAIAYSLWLVMHVMVMSLATCKRVSQDFIKGVGSLAEM
jgi:hypothetical protein